MSRPLRIEFPGALYHVTSRGDRREPIFEDNEDRNALLHVVGQGMERFDAQVLAYCLMGNHYHFVIHTRQANLSLLMRHLNGVYTQRFNRRHNKVGHLFQGRFKAILVDREAYLLQVCRYVELNPVRARMVAQPAEWPWSSYLAHLGLVASPPWLDTAGVHGYLLGYNPVDDLDRRRAASAYQILVAAGINVDLWAKNLRQQIFLGDETFVQQMQMHADPANMSAVEVPKTQRCQPSDLSQWLTNSPTRDEALWCAYKVSGITMSHLASELGLSVSRVSRIIANQDRQRTKGKT